MRKDGVKVKSDNMEYAIVPHIMAERNDALNMIELDIPVKPMQDYLNAKRKEGGERLSHLTIIMAAYARIVGEFPFINRFIVNKKIFARNELAISMVVLKSGQMDNGTMSKVYLDPADTIFDVNRKVTKYINDNRDAEQENSTDKLAKTLLSIPGLLRVGVNIFKWLDKHGLLPKAIIDASPFHASLAITNLASIRTNHIYHHLYNFGTTGVFISIGNSREVAKRDKNGEIYFEKCMPFGVVMDERLCSGSYFAMAFRKFNKYLSNPELLETPPAPESVIKETPYKR